MRVIAPFRELGGGGPLGRTFDLQLSCLDVQGNEAAVVGFMTFNGAPYAWRFVLRDNGSTPDEVVSADVFIMRVPDCAFTPGQPAEAVFTGDIDIHDTPPARAEP